MQDNKVQLSIRAILILVATAGIAVLALYSGQPVESAVISTLGGGWTRELADMESILGTFAIMLGLTVAAGWLAGINPFALGLTPSRSAAIGLGFGLSLVVVAVGASYAVGSAIVTESSAPQSPLFPIMLGSLAYLIVAVAEETLFRGWAQPLVARYWGNMGAVVATSIVFALSHSIFAENSSLGLLNLFLGSLVMGMLALRFGGVAAPIMFHFGWNWADYFLFALTPNPGRFSFGAITDVELLGVAQVGGVADGLMANIFATLILVAMAAYLLMQLRQGAAGPKSKPKSGQPLQGAPLPKAAELPAQPAAAPAPAGDGAANPQPLVSATEGAESQALPETILAFDDNAPKDDPAAVRHSWVQTATHQGCVRELNEDRYFVREDAGIFVVADGMGGHKFGDRASTLIVEHVAAVPEKDSLEARLTAVSGSVLTANRAIHAEAQSNGSRMGSTVVALLIDANRYSILWAGDSRAYRLRAGDVQQLTKDHTQVQEMVDRGLLQPQDVARHPMSHVLVRAVGVNPEIELDEVHGEIQAGDVYFLCSDGIYDVLEEDEIAALLAKSGKIDAMEKMISMALDLGARDNVTGIIVRPQLAG